MTFVDEVGIPWCRRDERFPERFRTRWGRGGHEVGIFWCRPGHDEVRVLPERSARGGRGGHEVESPGAVLVLTR